MNIMNTWTWGDEALDNKREELKSFCLHRDTCAGCPLSGEEYDCCFSIASDEMINAFHSIVFKPERNCDTAPDCDSCMFYETTTCSTCKNHIYFEPLIKSKSVVRGADKVTNISNLYLDINPQGAIVAIYDLKKDQVSTLKNYLATIKHQLVPISDRIQTL